MPVSLLRSERGRSWPQRPCRQAHGFCPLVLDGHCPHLLLSPSARNLRGFGRSCVELQTTSESSFVDLPAAARNWLQATGFRKPSDPAGLRRSVRGRWLDRIRRRMQTRYQCHDRAGYPTGPPASHGHGKTSHRALSVSSRSRLLRPRHPRPRPCSCTRACSGGSASCAQSAQLRRICPVSRLVAALTRRSTSR